MPRALIVDDDPQIQQLLTWLLERHGFQVWSAESGTEAVDIFLRAAKHKTPFRYIFLDHDMGAGEDGTWLARNLAERASSPYWWELVGAPGYDPVTFVVHSLNPEGASRMTSILRDAGLRVRRIPKNRLVEILWFYRRKK